MNLKSNIRTLCCDGIWIAVLLISLPWLAWRAIFQKKNRRGWKQKLFGQIRVSEKPQGVGRIWLHAVSVGEVHLLKTIIQHFKSHADRPQFVISTTTETGYDRAIELFADQHDVCFFPFDFSWAVRQAISIIDADLLVLAELELWPNLIHLCDQKDLPVVVANGRLGEKSYRNYRKFHFFTRSMFRKISKVGAQDAVYADRFAKLGCDPDRVTVTGNLKYDAIETDRKNVQAEHCRGIAADFGMASDKPILIAGSTQLEDETIAVGAWIELKQSFADLQLILVPRHPERIDEIQTMIRDRGLVSTRRSGHKSNAEGCGILIVDVIGELSGWWALADVAFVGGSMGSRGGQNMIEPAAYGLPVCFGPNTWNFKTTVEGLLEADGAKVINNVDELVIFSRKVLGDQVYAQSVGRKAQEFVQRHRGAADRTVEILRQFVKTDSVEAERAA